MALTYAPFGLKPASSLLSCGLAGGNIRMFYVPSTDSTAIGIGDPVKLAGSADAAGVPTVTRMATPGTDVIVGVMTGVLPDPSDLTLNYRKASTGMYIYVNVDPNTVYWIQENTGGTALTAAEIGLNSNLVLGTVDTVTGNGKTVLSNAAEATTSTLDVQILGLAPIVGNEIGTNAVWEVRINKNQYKESTTGI